MLVNTAKRNFQDTFINSVLSIQKHYYNQYFELSSMNVNCGNLKLIKQNVRRTKRFFVITAIFCSTCFVIDVNTIIR